MSYHPTSQDIKSEQYHKIGTTRLYGIEVFVGCDNILCAEHLDSGAIARIGRVSQLYNSRWVLDDATEEFDLHQEFSYNLYPQGDPKSIEDFCTCIHNLPSTDEMEQQGENVITILDGIAERFWERENREDKYGSRLPFREGVDLLWQCLDSGTEIGLHPTEGYYLHFTGYKHSICLGALNEIAPDEFLFEKYSNIKYHLAHHSVTLKVIDEIYEKDLMAVLHNFPRCPSVQHFQKTLGDSLHRLWQRLEERRKETQQHQE